MRHPTQLYKTVLTLWLHDLNLRRSLCFYMDKACRFAVNSGSIDVDRWFERLTDASDMAANEIALKDSLDVLTRELGFEYYAYLNLKALQSYAVSNYADEWQSMYFENEYAVIDPVVVLARRKMQAFAWTHDQIDGRSKDIHRFVSQAADFNIRSGISIPVVGAFGSLAMLTLATGSRTSLPDRHINPVLAASSVAQVHARFARQSEAVTMTAPVANLKPEERVCLRWEAEGKTMEDIAKLEGMKYNNVVFHLKGARKKLDAQSLQHATALATKFNLI